MTNPDNVGGLNDHAPVPLSEELRIEAALISGDVYVRGDAFVTRMTRMAEQAERLEELCRAAPAGSGEVERLKKVIDNYERGLISTPYTRAIVDQVVAREMRYYLEVIRLNRVVARQSAKIKRQRALLRKLQQGAEYETPSIECYSYDGDQWFDAPDDVELVAGRRTGDTFELMVSHYSIQRKYVVKKAPDSFGDDYEVEPVRAASQGQEGGHVEG